MLNRFRFAARRPQPVVVALEVGRRLRQQEVDHLYRLIEAIESLLDAGKLDPVGLVLMGEPAGPDPQIEPAVGDDVERRRHVGQHRRVPVGVAGHHHPEP